MSNILVCVTKQDTVKHLIEEGVRLKNRIGGNISVLHVTKKKIADFTNEIQFLYDICKDYDANFGIIHSDSIVKAITKYAEENNIDKIVLGATRQDNVHKSTMFKLQSALYGISEVVIVPIKEEFEYKDVM